MKTENILIANLNDDACEENIKRSISEINGVESVVVNKKEESVTIQHVGTATTEEFLDKLHSVGYRDYQRI